MTFRDQNYIRRPLPLAAIYTLVVLGLVATTAYSSLHDVPLLQATMADSFGPISVIEDEPHTAALARH